MAKNAPAPVVSPETLTTVPVNGERNARDQREPEPSDGRRLFHALDALDERIKLLLAGHSLLAQRVEEATAARREAEEQLARFSSGELDAAALEAHARELQVENERLSRHAAYLEERVASLLARVRYVVES